MKNRLFGIAMLAAATSLVAPSAADASAGHSASSAKPAKCYVNHNGVLDANQDMAIIGPLNTLNNFQAYTSTNGTCVHTSASAEVVAAGTHAKAFGVCAALLPPHGYLVTHVRRLSSLGWTTTPRTWWLCTKTSPPLGDGSTTPAGWYDDPNQPGQQQYWDGNQWTGQMQPSPA